MTIRRADFRRIYTITYCIFMSAGKGRILKESMCLKSDPIWRKSRQWTNDVITGTHVASPYSEKSTYNSLGMFLDDFLEWRLYFAAISCFFQ